MRSHLTFPELSDSMPSLPDTGGVASDLLDFAETAADAISSVSRKASREAAEYTHQAADYVSDIDLGDFVDYVSAARRRRKILTGVGVVALVIVALALIKRKRSDRDTN